MNFRKSLLILLLALSLLATGCSTAQEAEDTPGPSMLPVEDLFTPPLLKPSPKRRPPPSRM